MTELWHKQCTLRAPVCICWRVECFGQVIRQDLSEMWAFRLRPEGWERVSHVKSSGKRRKGVERPCGGRRGRCPSLCGEHGVKGLEMKLETGAKTRSCRAVSMCKSFIWGAMGYCWKVLSKTKREAGHLENAHHFGFKVSNGFRRGRMVACLHCYQSCLATDWVAYKKKKTENYCSQFGRL